MGSEGNTLQIQTIFVCNFCNIDANTSSCRFALGSVRFTVTRLCFVSVLLHRFDDIDIEVADRPFQWLPLSRGNLFQSKGRCGPRQMKEHQPDRL